MDLTGTPIERPAALYEHNKIRKIATERATAATTDVQSTSVIKVESTFVDDDLNLVLENMNEVVVTESDNTTTNAEELSVMKTGLTLLTIRSGVLIANIQLSDLLGCGGI